MNQNNPHSRSGRDKTQSHPPSEHSDSPSILPGDARITRPSDAAINPQTPEIGEREEDRDARNGQSEAFHCRILTKCYAATSSELYESASREGLSGVNLHTNSTEFYGNSSNLAFLGNLYAGARNQADDRAHEQDSVLSPSTTNSPAEYRPGVRGNPVGPSPEGTESRSIRPESDRTHPSIVNLLYNPDYSRPLSRSQGETQNDRGTEPGNNGPGELSRNTMNGKLKRKQNNYLLISQIGEPESPQPSANYPPKHNSRSKRCLSPATSPTSIISIQ